MLAIGPGEGGVLAVEDDGVGRVPLFDDLQAAVDLSAQLGIGEVVEVLPTRPSSSSAW